MLQVFTCSMMGKKEVWQSCFQFLNFCDFVWNYLYRIWSFIFLSVFHFCFFIACLPFWVFSSHTIIFHSYGDGIIAGEGLQILTYSRHSWSLSSEGSLAWNTYYDTGHPFIMVISEDLFHTHTYCRAFRGWAVTAWFNDLGLNVAAGVRTLNLQLARRTL